MKSRIKSYHGKAGGGGCWQKYQREAGGEEEEVDRSISVLITVVYIGALPDKGEWRR
jgi:hypothetical protein